MTDKVPSSRNLALAAERAFQRFGDRDAVHFEGRWHRSGELRDRTLRLAGGLARLGVRPGDRVVLSMSNDPTVGVCYTALWRAGAAITPAIFILAEPELRHILADSEAVAVITSEELLPKVRAAVEGVASLRWLISTGGDGAIPLAELEAEAPIGVVPRRDEDLAALMYTGGTTGRAKGVMLSHANLWYAGHASHEASHTPGVTRSLVTLPLSHAFGLLVTVIGFHAVDPPASALERWFDAGRFVRLVEEMRIEQAPVVPSMLQMLLGQPLEEHDLSSLRILSSGASPLPPEVAVEIEGRIPGVEVREGYGCTESASIISATRPGRRRLGAVGEPVPGLEVRIIDESGGEVPPGEPGEICVRSPGVMLGYWRAPEATAAAVADGWLRTGDIGRQDGDGFLRVIDRKKDLIIRGGFNVFPRDVEDALAEHPAVALAGVVGRPDPELGEEVVAFVSLRPGAEAGVEELVEFGRRRLGGYKYPREVRLLPALPLTPVGKVDRKRLRALLR
ncbi:MAG: class I adenylate-forming enzyme family protein [Candidatus Dormibacteraceae bacterium]